MYYNYGNPHYDYTSWDKIQRAKDIQNNLKGIYGDGTGLLSAVRDWSDMIERKTSSTHKAAKAAGFTGDTAGAADLLLHYQLGKVGRWANQLVDRSGWKNIYDNTRDAQIDAWNKEMGSNASYENLFKDVVNNPGNWELRPDPVQDPAQKKGLEGRRLYPYKQIDRKPPVSGRKFSYGPKSPKSKRKAPKRESAYQRERRKRKEEEQDAFQRMLMQYNQGMQNSISRPSIVPKPVWDAYVPDEGMSNYAVFDDFGRFEGLDSYALLDSMGMKDLPYIMAFGDPDADRE